MSVAEISLYGGVGKVTITIVVWWLVFYILTRQNPLKSASTPRRKSLNVFFYASVIVLLSTSSVGSLLNQLVKGMIGVVIVGGATYFIALMVYKHKDKKANK